MKDRCLSTIIATAFLAALCTARADAALVPRDLLGGLGGFENSCYSRWVSSYNGTDYDWNAPGRWSYGPNKGYRWGVSMATKNDTVAERWTRESKLHPDKLIYQLVDNDGGKCQYFGIREGAGDDASTDLHTDFPVGKEPYKLNAGDVVVFAIDSIRMEGYSGLNCTYRLRLSGVTGPTASTVLPPSSKPYSSSVTGTIAPNATGVRATVLIQAPKGTGDQVPGIYIDDAHLTIQRGGSLLREEVPVRTDRGIKTLKVFVTGADDPYSTAQNYDFVDLQLESDYWFARRLKYYNPNIKVYLYEGPWVNDWREPKYGNRDSVWSNSPVGMAFAVKRDAESGKAGWLYPHGNGWFRLGENAYAARLGDPTFQKVWIANALGKVTKYKLDGLFIDGPVVKLPSGKFPGIEPWEEQSLLHATMTSRPEGMDIIHNLCGCNLVTGFHPNVTNSPWKRWPEQGSIFFDPTWKPQSSREYTLAKGYRPNTPDNTVDGMFQENAFWGFGGARNWYNQAYAEACLNDMDAVERWNGALAANRKKWVHIQFRGSNRPNADPPDPAYGTRGWVNFGLCCYLLGGNDWTTLAISVDNAGVRESPTAQFGEATKLGEPAGKRSMSGAIGQRRHYGNDSGAVGGIAVANISRTDAGVYSPDFDFIGQDGAFHPAGSVINLGAHSGRILYHQNNYKYISVVTSPTEGKVVTGAALTVKGRVAANRSGLALPRTVQVRIDDGDWIDCPVDGNGIWSATVPVSPGSHKISSRAYVSSSDYEPEKRSRAFSVKRP